MTDLIVDAEFQNLIPPLTDEEFAQLNLYTQQCPALFPPNRIQLKKIARRAG